MTLAELLAIIYRYYPRGITQNDPNFSKTPEHQALIAASLSAGQGRPRWLAMLARLRPAFPGCTIFGDALHILSPNFAAACYPGILFLPATEEVKDHRIGFQVSFLAPYYVLYSECCFRADRPPTMSFAPDDSERAAWNTIAKEIEATYQAARLPPEIGHIIVPDVQPGSRVMGEAMIYDCFFDDCPRLVAGEDHFRHQLQKEYEKARGHD